MIHHYGKSRIKTVRIGCLDYEEGAQTCAFEGLICINTSYSTRGLLGSVYFIDDTKEIGAKVSADHYAQLFRKPSSPWFHGPKWDGMSETVAPHQSGLEALYYSSGILEGKRIKWVPTLWLFDVLSFANHNNDMLADYIWMLDAQLYRNSTKREYLSEYQRKKKMDHDSDLFEDGPKYVYTPHSISSFRRFESRSINRLTLALALNLDPKRLFRASTNKTLPFFMAYPELSKRFIMHQEVVRKRKTDFLCTSRLTTGAKRFFGANDRVCEHIRRAGYKLFNIRYPQIRSVGATLRYPQPPRNIVVIQRHINRGFYNVKEVMSALHKSFDPHGIPIKLMYTSDLEEPESWVRAFSEAGVLITTHGSQSMGQFWMPRYSVFVEVLPVGFYDYTFQFLAHNCALWYHGLESMKHPRLSKEFYRKKCEAVGPVRLNRCRKIQNAAPVIADIHELLAVTRKGLAQIGYEISDWIDEVPSWPRSKMK